MSAPPGSPRMRTPLLCAVLLLAGCAAPGAPRDAPAAPVFGAPVAVDPETPASEPRIVAAPDGTLWVSAMPGNRPGTAFGIPHVSGLWSSADGRAWTRVPWSPAPAGLGAGGGDSDVAVGADGTLLVVDAWGGSDAAGVSRDGGRTWTRATVTGEAPFHDRPWAAVDREGRAYVVARAFAPGALAWVARSDDGGASWRTVGRAWTADPPTRSPSMGNLVVDGDALRAVYACRPDALCLVSSADAGVSWAEERVAALAAPLSGPFPILAADGAGGLHVAWTEEDARGHAVWLASKPPGGAWGAPRQVSPPGGNHLMPWVDARPGVAALAWYATEAEGDPNDPRDMAGARWRVAAARCAPACVLADAARDVHAGTVNTLGVAGDARTEPPDWTLGDFLSVALDARGRMHVAYTTGTEEAPRAMHVAEA